MLPVFVAKKLSKEVKEKIRNKMYTEEELKQIYASILKDMEDAKSGFIFNAVLFLLVFGFMGYQATQIRGFAVIGIGLSIVFYLIVLGVFYLNLTSAKRTFAKLIKENYPNDYESVLR